MQTSVVGASAAESSAILGPLAGCQLDATYRFSALPWQQPLLKGCPSILLHRPPHGGILKPEAVPLAGDRMVHLQTPGGKTELLYCTKLFLSGDNRGKPGNCGQGYKPAPPVPAASTS